ncbi:LPS translocon maturation chaperone LptM [Caldimonas thermodepolymerans]|uniref:LPS translocon maturation chaperone LptM n=1 Tax=Caldimonas thermodepolymerans TaxID=215580 RepID=UPI003AF3E4D6
MSTTSLCSSSSTRASTAASTACARAWYSLSLNGVGVRVIVARTYNREMFARASILVFGAATLLAVGVSGCGQKGPLYLPGPAATAPAGAASAPAPAASR